MTKYSKVLKKITQSNLFFQYPGVAKSIDSDVNNIMTALSLSNALPEGNIVGELLIVFMITAAIVNILT